MLKYLLLIISTAYFPVTYGIEHRNTPITHSISDRANNQVLFVRPEKGLLLAAGDDDDDAAWCRQKCSLTTLPTGDFGFRFWNCYNRCMGINVCP